MASFDEIEDNAEGVMQLMAPTGEHIHLPTILEPAKVLLLLCDVIQSLKHHYRNFLRTLREELQFSMRLVHFLLLLLENLCFIPILSLLICLTQILSKISISQITPSGVLKPETFSSIFCNHLFTPNIQRKLANLFFWMPRLV